MPHFEFTLTATDGLLLQGQGWEPQDHADKVLCILHGLGEHSGRYDYMAEVFNRTGCAVVAMDLRGHGRSEGRRGHAPNYAAFMSDISLLLDEAAARYPDRPRFLFGHSFGGNLAAYYAMRARPDIDGVILTSPLFRLAFEPPKWKTILMDLLYALHLTLSVSTGLEGGAMTRDNDVRDSNRDDPLAHKRVTSQVAVEMRRNGEWMVEHAAEFPLPILLMHGDSDRVTSAPATREFAAMAGSNATLKIWEGCYHELHNEPVKEQVFGYVIDWMKERH